MDDLSKLNNAPYCQIKFNVKDEKNIEEKYWQTHIMMLKCKLKLLQTHLCQKILNYLNNYTVCGLQNKML